jgi:pyrroloquinoline-quinone synthase
MEMAGEYPDVVVGCVGGGSNFAGSMFPFLRTSCRERQEDALPRRRTEALPQPDAGEYRYDFGDTAGMTPLMKMYTLGHTFMPPGIHAGGLRYHAWRRCSASSRGGLHRGAGLPQNPCFESAMLSSRARRASSRRPRAATRSGAIDEALARKRPARTASSSSTSAATATSTWRRTTTTSRAASFPRFLSAIHTRTESATVRQLLLENLWDEEHGERNHPALWLEFAEALGVPADEVRASQPNAETSALVNHFADVCANAPVPEALATLFAYEGQVPAVAAQKIAGLRDNYGFAPGQYEFFTVHEAADIAHSGAEMAAIRELNTDDDATIRAASAAADRLLAFLDGCYLSPGEN